MNFALHFAWFAWQLFGPEPPIVVSKETTYLTAPLRADGLPDYERYILEKMRAGVTPENNAAVLFLQAMGPRKMKQDEYTAIAKEIGLDQLPSEENLLEDYHCRRNYQAIAKWLRSINAIPSDEAGEDVTESGQDGISWQLEGFIDERILFPAKEFPWTSAKCPPLSKWVNRNRTQLDRIVEASRRSYYYGPSAKLFDDKQDVVGEVSPVLSPGGREVARALCARAMWHLGEGRHQKAWADLLAVHRLARLFGQSGKPLVEQFVGVAIEGMAMKGTVILLSEPQLPEFVAREILRDLLNLRPIDSFAETFRESERIMAIDTQLQFRSRGLRDLVWFGVDEPFLTILQWITFDWNNALIRTNRIYDELAAAASLPTWTEQQAAITKIEQQIHSDPHSPGMLVIGLLDRGYRSKLLSDYFMDLFLTASGAACEAGIRGVAEGEILKIAAALAVYCDKRGSYPKQISDLVPAILDHLPSDPYNGGSFIYRLTPNGYLLYTCGPNGKDDDGSHFAWDRYHGYDTKLETLDQVTALLGDEMPEIKSQDQVQPEGFPVDVHLRRSPLLDHIPKDADDIAIRVPLPKLELPKAK